MNTHEELREQECAKAKAKSLAKSLALIEQAEALFPIGLIKSKASLAEIEAICREAHVPFVDLSFPPSDKSLWFSYKSAGRTESERRLLTSDLAPSMHIPSNGFPVVWLRPSEFAKPGEVWQLFKGEIETGDIKQGGVGDCWFMASVACLAEFPELVRDLFVQSEVSEFGVYQVHLYKNGLKMTYTLDDLFPCMSWINEPMYARANGPELWVMLLEKAFAAAHGSYAQIEGGMPIEALIDLTGAPYRTFWFSDEVVKAQLASGHFFDYLLECTEKRYLMNTYTKLDWGQKMGDVKDGLVICHAYSVIRVVRTRNGNHELCQLRNPWVSV